MIKSISFDQQEIIQNIIKLYIPSEQIDVDPTYSKGNFYSNNKISQPKYAFDLIPQKENVIKADCRNLPLETESINSIIFDPPFLATTGPSLNSNDKNNIINKRFGVYSNEKELHQMYYDSLKEFWRILNPNGILIFKCQDKISSGKQYMSHLYICNMVEKIGCYIKDLFILENKTRITANWQKQQKHSRKYHCYFIVFEKPLLKRKISYSEIEKVLDK